MREEIQLDTCGINMAACYRLQLLRNALKSNEGNFNQKYVNKLRAGKSLSDKGNKKVELLIFNPVFPCPFYKIDVFRNISTLCGSSPPDVFELACTVHPG